MRLRSSLCRYFLSMRVPLRVWPSCVVQALVVMPSAVRLAAIWVGEPMVSISSKMRRTTAASASLMTNRRLSRRRSPWTDAAHPHPLALGGGDLVADALAGDLALKLGEGQQDVEHQPPIEVVVLNCWVTDTKGHPLAFEHFDHLGEVGQAARQAVDLVDHHDVDLAALDIGHQAFQPRPIRVAAGETGVVVVVGHRNPPSDRWLAM